VHYYLLILAWDKILLPSLKIIAYPSEVFSSIQVPDTLVVLAEKLAYNSRGIFFNCPLIKGDGRCCITLEEVVITNVNKRQGLLRINPRYLLI